MKSDYDIFFCHNSKNKKEIREISDHLTNIGYNVWFDEKTLIASSLFIDEIQEAISDIPAIAIFIGNEGFGKWHKFEMQNAILEFINRGCAVIPVILKTANKEINISGFLKMFHCIDFREDEKSAYKKLSEGIDSAKKLSITNIKNSSSFQMDDKYIQEVKNHMLKIKKTLKKSE